MFQKRLTRQIGIVDVRANQADIQLAGKKPLRDPLRTSALHNTEGIRMALQESCRNLLNEAACQSRHHSDRDPSLVLASDRIDRVRDPPHAGKNAVDLLVEAYGLLRRRSRPFSLSNSTSSASDSRFAIILLIAGCDTCRTTAARLMVPCSITALNASI
jgi:hypothetical protein